MPNAPRLIIDLSIGTTVGVGCILVCWLMVRQGWPVIPAIGVGIASGVVVGLGNTLLVNKVGIRNGSYNVWGAVIAVYVVATGAQGLLLAGAPLWLPDLFNGIVLLLAVGPSIRRSRARVRATGRETERAADDATLATDTA